VDKNTEFGYSRLPVKLLILKVSKKSRILVVEDEQIVGKDIQSRLEQVGYEVPEIASTSVEAIEIAGRIKPDLIIMDIVLKGSKDGISTAEEIKSLYDIPIIYLTAYEDEKTLEKAKVTEPFGYILKPFSERELHATIEMALYKHRMDSKLRMAYEELKKTQQALIQAEKLAALGRLSSGIAHELRNPLANISASAQIALRAYGRDLCLKKYLDIIMRNSHNADRIIRELLDFASPKEMDFNEGSINQVLQHILVLVKPRCEEQKVDIITYIPEDLPKLKMNQRKLEQALLNFISNSIEAMTGGGNLEISARHHDGSDEMTILIKDTGHGISAENKDKVFEPFFTTKDNGTGLGLSIAYQTIRSHSGAVTLESEPGKGTCVEIRLPIVPRTEAKSGSSEELMRTA